MTQTQETPKKKGKDKFIHRWKWPDFMACILITLPARGPVSPWRRWRHLYILLLDHLILFRWFRIWERIFSCAMLAALLLRFSLFLMPPLTPFFSTTKFFLIFVSCVGRIASTFFLILPALWCHFTSTAGTRGSIEDWFVPFLNSYLSAGHSQLHFGCDSCTGLGWAFSFIMCVYVKFWQHHIALIYLLFTIILELFCVFFFTCLCDFVIMSLYHFVQVSTPCVLLKN
jgi:hypothetical protein